MANESEQSGLTFPDAYVKGALLLHRGDLEGARRSFETAREEAQGSKAPRLVTAVLGNLGNVYAALNEKEKARSLYREVLEHQRKDPNEKGVKKGSLHCHLIKRVHLFKVIVKDLTPIYSGVNEARDL